MILKKYTSHKQKGAGAMESKRRYVYSVIIPTYNSERTMAACLEGIRSQDYNQDEIQIIVVDGGSTDATKDIANKYGAEIVDNPYKLPEPAKLIGMGHAKGRLACIMGSDEIITDKRIFKKRQIFLEENPNIHGLLAELVAPKDYQPCCTYMNAVGDPFTCFVYKTYGNRVYNLRKRLYAENDMGYIYKFHENDIYPIGDGGTVMDLDYLRANYPKEVETIESSVLWDYMIRDTKYVGVIKNDLITHLSSADFKTYLKKLRFRVINNVHSVEGSGYAYRAQTNKKLNARKYLFPLYAILVPWPIYDGIQMALRMKNTVFLLHPIFVWYVIINIVFEYIKKFFGKKSVNKTYGK